MCKAYWPSGQNSPLRRRPTPSKKLPSVIERSLPAASVNSSLPPTSTTDCSIMSAVGTLRGDMPQQVRSLVRSTSLFLMALLDRTPRCYCRHGRNFHCALGRGRNHPQRRSLLTLRISTANCCVKVVSSPHTTSANMPSDGRETHSTSTNRSTTRERFRSWYRMD